MSRRLDRTSIAAILLIALGTFAVANASIGIASADRYEAIVLDVMERSLGGESAFLEAWGGFTARLIRIGSIVGLLEGVFNWLAGAAVLTRGHSWGRIAGLVVGAVGLFDAAYRLLAYTALSQWTAPLPAFAWLDPDPALVSSAAANALAVAGYAAILVLLARGRRGHREGTIAR